MDGPPRRAHLRSPDTRLELPITECGPSSAHDAAPPAHTMGLVRSWGRSWPWSRAVVSCKTYLYRIEVSWRCPVAPSAVITQCPFSASLWQRPTHKQAAKRVRTKIAGGQQPRTSVPQLPLRRNASPPGRGPRPTPYPTPNNMG
jgi:hypothetical protein